MNNRLLINGRPRNLYWSSCHSSFFLNTFKDWFKFSLFDLRFIDIYLLIDGMFFRLNISVILDFISWNLNCFLNLFIRVLSGKNNWFSFNNLVFSINKFWFCSDEFVKNSRLLNNFLSDWKLKWFWNHLRLSSYSFSKYFGRGCNSLLNNFWLSSN